MPLTVTIELDDITVEKLRNLKGVRETIRQTHGYMDSCGGCSSCEYQKELNHELEGLMVYLVMKAVGV